MSISTILDSPTIVKSTSLDTGQTDAEIAAEEAEQERINFLNLLLTQLQNQNPLDPMDTDEYTAQLTRYSQLEQQIETNEKLTLIEELVGDANTVSSFSYIGKDVELGLNSGVIQDGEASWSYLINGSADDAYITITDEDGNVVYEADGSTSVGAQTFTLNAEDAGLEEGEQLYFFVSAVDNSGGSYETVVTSHVTVDGVWSNGDSGSYLTAGEISFDLSEILRIET